MRSSKEAVSSFLTLNWLVALLSTTTAAFQARQPLSSLYRMRSPPAAPNVALLACSATVVPRDDAVTLLEDAHGPKNNILRAEGLVDRHRRQRPDEAYGPPSLDFASLLQTDKDKKRGGLEPAAERFGRSVTKAAEHVMGLVGKTFADDHLTLVRRPRLFAKHRRNLRAKKPKKPIIVMEPGGYLLVYDAAS